MIVPEFGEDSFSLQFISWNSQKLTLLNLPLKLRCLVFQYPHYVTCISIRKWRDFLFNQSVVSMGYILWCLSALGSDSLQQLLLSATAGSGEIVKTFSLYNYFHCGSHGRIKASLGLLFLIHTKSLRMSLPCCPDTYLPFIMEYIPAICLQKKADLKFFSYRILPQLRAPWEVILQLVLPFLTLVLSSSATIIHKCFALAAPF